MHNDPIMADLIKSEPGRDGELIVLWDGRRELHC